MADSQKLSGVGATEVNSANGFDSFQSQLDAFLEQEKAAIAETEQDANESQRRLDRFINNLQQECSIMNGSSNPVSYSKLIFRVLIGASCVTLIVLWLLWPIEQISQPKIVQQQPNDVSQPRPALALHEITADEQPSTAKPVVETASVDALSRPAIVAQPTTTEQHKITKVEKASPPEASMAVRLKVAVRIGNIRNKPDRSGKVLYRLAQGAVVTRLAGQKDWFQVRLRNGTIAWAHRSIFQSE